MSTVKLYGSFTSPFVRHCRYVLESLEIPFEFIETDYDQSAEGSPLKKVPFMTAGSIKLTDSSSILKYAREKSGAPFLPDLMDFDRYAMINTVMDAAVNIFLLERCGITAEHAPYLARQSSRVSAGLLALNECIDPEQALLKDCHIRCACFVDWAIYRERLEFSAYPNLEALSQKSNADNLFARTAPPTP
jgi:glutathione S-transferase